MSLKKKKYLKKPFLAYDKEQWLDIKKGRKRDEENRSFCKKKKKESNATSAFKSTNYHY